MLTLTIKESEFFKQETQEFIYTKDTTLQMEHSLVSISKWESKWKKPFLSIGQPGYDEFTQEMLIDYFKCMTITQNVPENVYYAMRRSQVEEVVNYIKDEQTATWFGKQIGQAGKVDRRPMTSERIYYLMVHYGIPFECQKWHLSRLLTLIHVCQVEEQTQEKKSPKDAALMRHNLNTARRAKRPH